MDFFQLVSFIVSFYYRWIVIISHIELHIHNTDWKLLLIEKIYDLAFYDDMSADFEILFNKKFDSRMH